METTFNYRRRSAVEAELSPIDQRSRAAKMVADFQLSGGLMDDASVPDYAKALIQQMAELMRQVTTLVPQKSPLDEMMDYKRQHEVVITNFKESEASTPMGRANDDLAAVKEMLNEGDIEEPPAGVYRMGRRDTGKYAGHKRLLKVVFYTRASARRFLQVQKKLAAKFPGVKARQSMSPLELENRKKMFAECKRMREETGKDYIIYAEKVVLREEIRSNKK
jgi:hypothetical protein